jgi:hypothetical protein
MIKNLMNLKSVFILALLGQFLASCSNVDNEIKKSKPKISFDSIVSTAIINYKPSNEPGSTNFNSNDRLAINNLIQTYSLTYDNYNIKEWLDLFTADAVFVVGLPGEPAIEQSGEMFRKFWLERGEQFKTSGNKRRHLMSNLVFIEENDSTAHLSITGLLVNVKDKFEMSVISPLNYEGWFLKKNGVWKIRRWHDFPDRKF